MKTIKATLERAKDGTYSVYCIDQPYTGMGNTPEEAKKDMMDAMKFHKETCIKEGIYYPGFLDEPFEVTFDAIPWF